MFRVYLSGKIRNISYDLGTSWRDEATEYLSQHTFGAVETLDPMRDKETLAGVESMPRSTDDMFCQPRNVFSRDVWDVRLADIVLADLRAGNGRFTMFELGMAFALNIPIILVSDNPEVDDSLPLVHAPAAIFSNPTDALDYIISMVNR